MHRSKLCIPEGVFTEESDKEAQERIRFELLVDHIVEVAGKEEEEQERVSSRASEPLAFVLHDLLSKSECDLLRDCIDGELEGTTRVDGIGNRECDRAVLFSPELAKHCYARARPFLEKIVRHFRVDVVEQMDGSHDRLDYIQSFTQRETIAEQCHYHAAEQRQALPVTLSGYDASRILFSDEKSFNWEGSWELGSMKEVVSCLRYQPGDHFDMHEDDNQDGPGHSLETPVKSLFTGLLYLNSDFTGGNTNFKSHTEGHRVLLELNPSDATAAGAPGCLLFFFQKGLLHEGHRVLTGNKYVIRSDLFYRQVEKGNLSSEELQGLAFLNEARELFAAGDMARCQKKYDQACKLNAAILRMSFEG